MAQLINRRSNRTALQVTVTVGAGNSAPVINFTDSKSFAWTAAAPTDSGKDISKFFKKFAIQLTTDTSGDPAGTGVNYTLQANVGGIWVSCPAGLASNTNANTVVLRAADHDIITVSLPVHGIQLRLLAVTNAETTNDQTITILMSDSSERADVGRT